MASNGNGSVNILSKVDRSIVKSIGGSPVSKVSRYDWSTGGSIGKFAWISKADLNIDGRYQRDQVSEDKVREIAGKWDWLLIGTLSVIKREDGTYWVFDGGHRTRAAFYRDDVKALPCMVHNIASVNDEAKAFVARNTMVSSVSAFDRFHAAVCADEPVAQAADAMLKEFGLTPIKGGHQTGKYLCCIGALQKCIETNSDDARKVLAQCLKLAGEQIVSSRMLLAMFTLHQHFKPQFDIIDRFHEKLERHSQKEIEVRISQFATQCGKSGAVIFAKAILEIINHKMRNRIEW